MARIAIADITLFLKRVLVIVAAALAAIALFLSLLWRDRVPLDDIELPRVMQASAVADAVTATWFGVGMLLIDDGQTQILIDSFVSRPSLLDVLSGRPVNNDVATINYFLNEYEIRRLAAIIPTHSHFDHAMDVGAIANRSSASILGSETTALIARGVGVPEDQIVVVEDAAEYTFGGFTVRFIESVHAPVGWGGSVPFPGALREPLAMPAPVAAFREGGSFSILVTHTRGSALIQGSAGIREAALDELNVDTVLLSVGLLEGLGREYVERYWQKTVTSTGAQTVIPIHFDDYTRPFGQTELAPSIIDNFARTTRLLREFRDTWDADVELYLPVFAVPFELFPLQQADPEV